MSQIRQLLVSARCARSVLTSLDLSRNMLDAEAGKALAASVVVNVGLGLRMPTRATLVDQRADTGPPGRVSIHASVHVQPLACLDQRIAFVRATLVQQQRPRRNPMGAESTKQLLGQGRLSDRNRSRDRNNVTHA